MNNPHLNNLFIKDLFSQIEELSNLITNFSPEFDNHNELTEDLFIIVHTIKGNTSAHKNNVKNQLIPKEEAVIESIINFSHKTEDFLITLKKHKVISNKIISILLDIESTYNELLSLFNSPEKIEDDMNFRFVNQTTNKFSNLDFLPIDSNSLKETNISSNDEATTYILSLNCDEALIPPHLALVYREIDANYDSIVKTPSDNDLSSIEKIDIITLDVPASIDHKSFEEFVTKIEWVDSIKKFDNKTLKSPHTIDIIEEKNPTHNSSGLLKIEPSRIDNVLKHTSQLVILKNKLNEFLAENNFLAGTTKRKELESIFEDLTSHVEYLQESVLDIRMTPFEQLFSRFPMDVKKIGLEFDKNIHFVASGHRTEIDKNILDELYEPFIHLIRNSIIHGIETPDERISLGKAAIGEISIEAKHIKNKVRITLEDDGRGIDIESVKQKAISLNLFTKEQLSLMTNTEILNLIFLQGLTTSPNLTQYAGRGVGMSAFRKKVEELQGYYEIESIPNKGTKFTIFLPLTTTIIEAVITKINGDLYSIPLTQIEEITHINKNSILYNNSKPYFFWRNIDIPILIGRDIFKNNSSLNTNTFYENKNTSNTLKIVIVHSHNQLIGITFDEFISQQSIVVKQLHPFLNKTPEIDNYHIVSDGSISLIIDTNGLL